MVFIFVNNKTTKPFERQLVESQPWTVIEDKDSLANATMSQASLAFQNWVNTTSIHQNQFHSFTGRISFSFTLMMRVLKALSILFEQERKQTIFSC